MVPQPQAAARASMAPKKKIRARVKRGKTRKYLEGFFISLGIWLPFFRLE
jgi:hypothetical protein